MIPQLAGLIKSRDIKGETTYDIILKAYLEHKTHLLSDDLKQMLERWKKADSLLRSGEIVKKGANDIVRPYNATRLVNYLVEHFGVSSRTAQNDIAHAKRFFLSTYDRDDKEYARGIMIEWGETMMWEAHSLGDRKSAAAFFKTLAEMKGLLKDDPDLPDYSKVQLPTLVMVDDPSELGFEKIDNVDEVVAGILAKRKKSKMDQIIADSDIVEELPLTEEDGSS
jgi:hypothetical protein